MIKINHLVYATVLLFASCSPDKKSEENIDHLILAINNLDEGIAQFKELTGIEPLFGGIHPNSFTQNALVALDGDTYIEIMAPRPDAENVPEFIIGLNKLTPVGWAVRSRAIDRTKKKLESVGFVTTEKREGSRAKPDGTVLSWITFGVESNPNFPFFIEWGVTSVHPSTSSPKGCRLQSVTLTTDNVEPVKKLKNQLKLGVTVVKGSENSLQFTIDTPKGKITFPVHEQQSEITSVTSSVVKLIAQTNTKVQLNHIAVYVVNLKTSTNFYRDIIGLDTIPEPFHDGKHTWFSVGYKSHLHLISGASRKQVHDKNSHLCFSVASVDEFIQVLRKNKIEYENWPGEKMKVTNRVDGVKQIYFKDPDGYWIEINDARE